MVILSRFLALMAVAMALRDESGSTPCPVAGWNFCWRDNDAEKCERFLCNKDRNCFERVKGTKDKACSNFKNIYLCEEHFVDFAPC